MGKSTLAKAAFVLNLLTTMHYHKHDWTEPLFPCTTALQTPNPPFWTTKTAVPKFPQNGGSTPSLCLDKAMHAQGGGGGYMDSPQINLKGDVILGTVRGPVPMDCCDWLYPPCLQLPSIRLQKPQASEGGNT